MIVEYNICHDEEIKDLFVELQEYIASIDEEGFNVLTTNYREEYLKKTIKEIEEHN